MAEQEPGRDLPLGDDDPDLARFFAGDDLSVDMPVGDGGKGLTPLDALPCEDCG